ncbi:MAG: DUF814 domain-containing protein [Bdellovibrio sp.]|nr:DUF814 domain-containing protein [Bdellovibrio sp.]
MIPSLNWKEIEVLAKQLRTKIEGSFVDRVIVPERKNTLDGFLKSEWAIRFTSKTSESTVLFSLKPRQTYVTWVEGKGPVASTKATRSSFDLALSKYLRGAKLSQVETLPEDRVLVFKFRQSAEAGSHSGASYFALVLVMIPAAPGGYLVEIPSEATGEESDSSPKEISVSPFRWKVLAQSKKSTIDFFVPPSRSAKPPKDLAIRTDLIVPLEAYSKTIEKELEKEAFENRIQNIKKVLNLRLKVAEDRLEQSENAAREAQNEKDWQRFGDLLKSSLATKEEEISGNHRIVVDYETQERIAIPCDLSLSLKEQVEKFYHLAKRKVRRIREASERAETCSTTAKNLKTSLAELPLFPDWKSLAQFELLAGVHHGNQELTQRTTANKSRWSGKSFLSKDGLPIWVGKNRDENLELTFKYARGNDLWLHLRGKPGAHVVIPLSQGKSAPLETLLDAAVLVLQYSGGANWGVAEVDYTFKKYVKRIKNSKEVSYTHNKTLLVKPEPSRLKRLLSQMEK